MSEKKDEIGELKKELKLKEKELSDKKKKVAQRRANSAVLSARLDLITELAQLIEPHQLAALIESVENLTPSDAVKLATKMKLSEAAEALNLTLIRKKKGRA